MVANHDTTSNDITNVNAGDLVTSDVRITMEMSRIVI